MQKKKKQTNKLIDILKIACHDHCVKIYSH